MSEREMGSVKQNTIANLICKRSTLVNYNLL